MDVCDPVYGKFEVSEPVLRELLEEPAVLRAGNIMQGATTPLINGWRDFSRLEHCIGAMLIVKKLNGSIEAQIAALLHDISHTAFSHVVDYVYSREKTHDYHEHIKKKIIVGSTIPSILAHYGYDLDFILHEENFALVERNAPHLCADRVDYCLRSMSYYMHETSTARFLFEHIAVYDDEIVFASQESAMLFARFFYFLDHDILAFDRNVAAYCVFADALKKAIERNYIEEDDFLQTDDFVSQKLARNADLEVLGLLNKLTSQFAISEELENPDYVLKTKARWVNPKFINNKGTLQDILSIDTELESLIIAHTEKVTHSKGVKVL